MGNLVLSELIQESVIHINYDIHKSMSKCHQRLEGALLSSEFWDGRLRRRMSGGHPCCFQEKLRGQQW